MLLVPPRIAEIYFAVLDDWVAPIGYVQRAIRAKLHVNRPERVRRSAQQIRHCLCNVAGALFADFEANHAMCPEVARDQITLPIVRELTAVDDFEAAEFGIIAAADA